MNRTAISIATEQGPRERQEDSIALFRLADWEYFAIADGYGPIDPSGEQLSSVVTASLLQSATSAIKNHRDITDNNFELFFRAIFQTIHDTTYQYVSGSTLAVAFHNRRSQHFYTAVLGDSVITHIAQNGFETNPEKNLHLGRENLWGSFGDKKNARHHNQEPECRVFTVAPGEALLIASDGLFSGHGNTVKEDLAYYQQLILRHDIPASELVTIAHQEKKVEDNASAIIIRILNP